MTDPIEILEGQNFAIWREKFNELSEDIGALGNLTNPKSSIIDAINSLSASVILNRSSSWSMGTFIWPSGGSNVSTVGGLFGG